MKLSFQEIVVLRTVLNFSGELEPGQNGVEVNSPRKLNGYESSQRRHFIKNTQEVVETLTAKGRDLQKQLDDLKKEKGETSDEIKDAAKKFNEEYAFASAEEHEIEATDETIKTLNKYFLDWGEKVGWVPAEDDLIEKIEEKLSTKE